MKSVIFSVCVCKWTFLVWASWQICIQFRQAQIPRLGEMKFPYKLNSRDMSPCRDTFHLSAPKIYEPFGLLFCTNSSKRYPTQNASHLCETPLNVAWSWGAVDLGSIVAKLQIWQTTITKLIDTSSGMVLLLLAWSWFKVIPVQQLQTSMSNYFILQLCICQIFLQNVSKLAIWTLETLNSTYVSHY